MQRRLITVILFAFVAALISSTALYKVISANNSRPSVQPGTQVFVAARDLEAGALVGNSDVEAVGWQAPVSPQWITKTEDIVGRGVLTSINKGEPFPSSRLAAKGAGAGFTSRIPPGMRAVAVHVDESTGLNRLIMSGMHVDVISTGSGAASQGMVTRTILQNVEVLSMGQDVDHTAKDRPVVEHSVNLLVTPRQAELLSQAAAQNRIQLILRNPLDSALALVGLSNDPPPAEKKPTKMARAAATPAKPAAPEQAKPQPLPTIEVIHGAKKVTATVGLSPSASEAQETK